MADQSRISQAGHHNGVVNLSQLIHDHQEKAVRLPPIEEVRTLLNHSVRGFLSTFSQNLLANPKCSVLVARDPDDRTDLVVTVQGEALPVDKSNVEAVHTAYMATHPDIFWVDFGDSQLLRIEPRVIRYISGVATGSVASGEFSGEEFRKAKVDPIYQFSKHITSHMNGDHADDTKLIVQHSTSIPVEFASMLDVDSLGFNVKAGYQGKTFKLRIPFTRRATEREDVKNLLREMLQAAQLRGLPHV